MSALARDVRFGGAWSLGQTAKNGLVWSGIRAALACAPVVPGRLLGRAAYALLGRVARDNLRRALAASPEDAARLARAAFENLGGHFADALRVLAGGPIEDVPVTPGALDVLAAARAEGRGVVFASAHLGPWERVAAALVLRGVPLVTMTRDSYDPRITRLLASLRERAGVRGIARGAPGAAARIVRALRDGAVLGMPMDLRTRAPSVVVPFFGLPAETVVGPARLALRTGAPLVVGTVERRDGVLAVTATRLGVRGDEVAVTAALGREIERRIRTAPDEWPWMHPRFAAGEPGMQHARA